MFPVKRITIVTLILTLAISWWSYALFSPFLVGMDQAIATGRCQPDVQTAFMRFTLKTILNPSVFLMLIVLFTLIGVLAEYFMSKERQRLITHVMLLAACATVNIAFVYLLFLPVWKIGAKEASKRPNATYFGATSDPHQFGQDPPRSLNHKATNFPSQQ